MVVITAILVAGAAVHVANIHKKDRRKMAEMDVYSRKKINLPKRLSGIPKAIGKRAVTARALRLSDRELSFDEGSGTLYAHAPDSVGTFFSPSSESDLGTHEVEAFGVEKAEVSTDTSSEASNDRRYEIYDC